LHYDCAFQLRLGQHPEQVLYLFVREVVNAEAFDAIDHTLRREQLENLTRNLSLKQLILEEFTDGGDVLFDDLLGDPDEYALCHIYDLFFVYLFLIIVLLLIILFRALGKPIVVLTIIVVILLIVFSLFLVLLTLQVIFLALGRLFLLLRWAFFFFFSFLLHSTLT